MATFQSQINILAAANCGVKQRLKELESKKLEIHYGATETTIKDNDDDPLITINNLGYNAYDAMLIMKNNPSNPSERSYHLMGYDGENLDLGVNVELGAKIGKAMEEQTMKLMELTNMTNEKELLRWDFKYTFKSDSVGVLLDETDYSINYPILVKTHDSDSMRDITSGELIDFGTYSYYINSENIFIDALNADLSNKIIYYNTEDNNSMFIPIGFKHLNNPTVDSYYIRLDSSSIAGFTEELTITSNPEFMFEKNITLQTGENNTILELNTTDSLKFLSYNNDNKTMSIQKDDSNKISFQIINPCILRLVTGSITIHDYEIPIQYCYINIKKNNIKNLKVNNQNVNDIPKDFNISFPWGSFNGDNLFELRETDKILTKIDRGHLYTSDPTRYLDPTHAKYQNINIVNAMKPLQDDIKDEKEGEK